MYVNFKKVMERAKIKYEKDGNQARYIKEGMELAKKYILEYIEKNNIESAEELKKGVLESLYEDSQNFAAVSNIKNAVFEYEIMNLFIQNPDELERVYYKVKDEGAVNRNPHFIDKPFEQRKEDLMRDLIRTIEQFKEDNKGLMEISEKYKEGDKLAKKIINDKRNKLNPNKRKAFDEQFMCLQQGDLRMIKVFLPDCRESKGEDLRKSYIEILGFIGDFLKKNGLLNRYIKMNNQKLMGIGLSQLCIKESDNNILDREKIENMKLDELPVMTAFWFNRYTKEIKDFNNGIFAINTLDLWQDLLDGKTEFDISEKQLKAIFCKTEFIDIVNTMIDKSIKEKLNNNTAKITGKQDDVVAVDAQEEIDKIEELVRVEYYNEFEGILPTSYSKIIDDLEIALPLSSNTQNAYAHKNEIITTQILSYMRNKKIKNWGYIKEEKDGMIILGIDYEGYNMPVKVHIPKKHITKALTEAGLTPQIPMYQGNDDMFVNGEMLKTYIITNLTEKQEETIKNLVDENKRSGQVMNFLEHLNFLRNNSKYPKHLMETVTEKGKTFLVRSPKKYINIETNEIFVKDKKGNLKKEESEGR